MISDHWGHNDNFPELHQQHRLILSSINIFKHDEPERVVIISAIQRCIIARCLLFFLYWYIVEWANDFDSTYICIWSDMNKSLDHYVLRHKCYFLAKNDMFFNDIMSQPNISKFYLQISINKPMFAMHFTTGMAYIQ